MEHRISMKPGVATVTGVGNDDRTTAIKINRYLYTYSHHQGYSFLVFSRSRQQYPSNLSDFNRTCIGSNPQDNTASRDRYISGYCYFVDSDCCPSDNKSVIPCLLKKGLMMSKENEISSAEILHRNFSTSMFGYKKVEVESFLEKIAIYIEELEKKLSQYSRTKPPVKKDEKVDEEQKDREDLISKTLLIAEKTREDLIKNAQKEAENIVKEADLKGKKMLADAKNLVSVLEHQIYNLEEQKRIFLLKFKTEMEVLLKKINEDELLDRTKLEKARKETPSEPLATTQDNVQPDKSSEKDKE